jgi:hypothetical protein
MQVFYLIYNRPVASENAAREFADKMDALTDL